MAEIKVEEGLNAEINALDTAGEALSGKNPDLDESSSLPTCKAYRKRCRDLAEVLTSFSRLVDKDAREIQEFVDKMRSLDNS